MRHVDPASCASLVEFHAGRRALHIEHRNWCISGTVRRVCAGEITQAEAVAWLEDQIPSYDWAIRQAEQKIEYWQDRLDRADSRAKSSKR